MTRWIGYVRVSDDEQAASGLGLLAQEERIRVAVVVDGDELVEVIRDEGESGENLHRPGITKALAMIAAGEADGLIVARIDRLSRSVRDFVDLVDCFKREVRSGVAFRAL